MSKMTQDEWDGMSLLIEEAWPGEFTDTTSKAWMVFLSDYDATEVLGALKRIVGAGGRFRPSVGELVAEIRSDASTPTFPELLTLLHGKGGVFRARLPRNASYGDTGEMNRAQVQAWRDRAEQMHPLVFSFVERYGYDRLHSLELGDPEYGGVRRRDLEHDWTNHVAAMDGRELAEIAAGAKRGRGELNRFDPIYALRGMPTIGAPELQEENA